MDWFRKYHIQWLLGLYGMLLWTLPFCSWAVIKQIRNKVYNLSYEVSFPNATHHELEVVAHLRKVKLDSLKLVLSKTSVGKYTAQNYGENIYNLTAFDARTNRKLHVIQTTADIYTIPNPPSEVFLAYTVYSNRLDASYACVDDTHAHLNLPAILLYPIGMKKEPVDIVFYYPEKPLWKVTSQLKFIGDSVNSRYYAPNMAYLLDSSVELSDYRDIFFLISDTDKPEQLVYLSVHGNLPDSIFNAYAKAMHRVVVEQKAVFGNYPKFTFGDYSVINDIHPENEKDEAGHLNSASFTFAYHKDVALEMMRASARQFFFTWNGARITPKSLDDFYFNKVNVSSELWFIHGINHYYADLSLLRAGVISFDKYVTLLNESIQSLFATPATKIYSPIQVSKFASLTTLENSNKANIYAPYTDYGVFVALALDMSLRSIEGNYSLDGFMKLLWEKFGKKQITYNLLDLQKALVEYTHYTSFANDFFKKFVLSPSIQESATIFNKLGLNYHSFNASKAWMGSLKLKFENKNNPTVVENVLFGHPIYQAGIDIGDTLVKIDNVDIREQIIVDNILKGHFPNDEIVLTFIHRGEEKQGKVILCSDPSSKLVKFEDLNLPVTPDIERIRKGWMLSKTIN